jgi:hypothetical protein
MPVSISPTPNPNAMKFSVGSPVGDPATYTAASGAAGYASDILALPGVVSVFMTADFVTLTKAADADWDEIVPEATVILEAEFSS